MCAKYAALTVLEISDPQTGHIDQSAVRRQVDRCMHLMKARSALFTLFTW